MGTSAGGVWFRKLGEENGKAKPWHLRFSPSRWRRRWTRRPSTAAAKGGTSSVVPKPHRRLRRLGSLLLSFIRSVLFRVVEAVEAVVLVAGLCLFFVRFGCQL